jgi:peptidylprolyl isomerase
MKPILILALAALLSQGGKLEIKDTVEGKGPASQVGDILTVDYTGTLTDGTKFDSSIGKKPFQFIIGSGMVIKGWDQGMLGMKAGGKRQLTIPAHLGYGAEGAGEIPANATLKFDVTLLQIDRIKSEILTEGKGALKAKAGDTCDLHVDLTDTAGKKIWSTHDGEGKIFQIVVGRTGLIKGFTAGVLGMKQGEIRKITVPAEFGYGEKGKPPVEPNTTLVFKIEMVKLFSPEGGN